MKKIHESLTILHKCYLNINILWETIDRHREKTALHSVNHFTNKLTYYMILESESFFEEYNSHFVPSKIETEYSDRVRAVKNICKPIYKLIRKWKDLTSFRHNIIAHPWRKGSKFVVPLNKDYAVPRTWLEFRMLRDLIGYIHNILHEEFEVEMNESLFYAESLAETPTTVFSTDAANKALLAMQEEINQIMKQEGKDYRGQIFIYGT